jgi:hypothetical protein
MEERGSGIGELRGGMDLGEARGERRGAGLRVGRRDGVAELSVEYGKGDAYLQRSSSLRGGNSLCLPYRAGRRSESEGRGGRGRDGRRGGRSGERRRSVEIPRSRRRSVEIPRSPFGWGVFKFSTFLNFRAHGRSSCRGPGGTATTLASSNRTR